MMVRSCKHFFQECNSTLLKHLPGYKECMIAESFQEWLDFAYGMAGYSSREEYYEHSNPMNYCTDVPETKPLLVINSEDGNFYLAV